MKINIIKNKVHSNKDILRIREGTNCIATNAKVNRT